jgi:hypothetical protein
VEHSDGDEEDLFEEEIMAGLSAKERKLMSDESEHTRLSKANENAMLMLTSRRLGERSRAPSVSYAAESVAATTGAVGGGEAPSSGTQRQWKEAGENEETDDGGCGDGATASADVQVDAEEAREEERSKVRQAKEEQNEEEQEKEDVCTSFGLPSGWKTMTRIRTSGKTVGSKDRYYIAPVGKKKFRSIAEVKRYLEREGGLEEGTGAIDPVTQQSTLGVGVKVGVKVEVEVKVEAPIEAEDQVGASAGAQAGASAGAQAGALDPEYQALQRLQGVRVSSGTTWGGRPFGGVLLGPPQKSPSYWQDQGRHTGPKQTKKGGPAAWHLRVQWDYWPPLAVEPDENGPYPCFMVRRFVNAARISDPVKTEALPTGGCASMAAARQQPVDTHANTEAAAPTDVAAYGSSSTGVLARPPLPSNAAQQAAIALSTAASRFGLGAAGEAERAPSP